MAREMLRRTGRSRGVNCGWLLWLMHPETGSR